MSTRLARRPVSHLRISQHPKPLVPQNGISIFAVQFLSKSHDPIEISSCTVLTLEGNSLLTQIFLKNGANFFLKVQLNIVIPTNTGYVPSTEIDLSQSLLGVPDDGDILPTYLVDNSSSLEFWLSPKVMPPNGQLFNYSCHIVDSDVSMVSTHVFVSFGRVNVDGIEPIQEFQNKIYPFSLDILNRIDGQTKVLIKTINFIPGCRYILAGYDLPVLSENEVDESVICMVPPVLQSLHLTKSVLGVLTDEYFSQGPVDVTFEFSVTVENLFRFLASLIKDHEEEAISMLIQQDFQTYSNLATAVDFNELLVILHTDGCEVVNVVQDLIDISVLHFGLDLNAQDASSQMSLFLYLVALGMTDVAFHLIDNYEDVVIDDISITGYNAMDFALLSQAHDLVLFLLDHGIGPTTTSFSSSDTEDFVSVRVAEDSGSNMFVQGLSDLQEKGAWDQLPTTVPMSGFAASVTDNLDLETKRAEPAAAASATTASGSTNTIKTTRRTKTITPVERLREQEDVLKMRRLSMFNIQLGVEKQLFQQATVGGVSAVSTIGTRVEPKAEPEREAEPKKNWRLSAVVTPKSMDFSAFDNQTPSPQPSPSKPTARPTSKLRAAPVSATLDQESEEEVFAEPEAPTKGPTLADIVTWDRDKVLDWVVNTLNIAKEFAQILHNQWIDGRVLINLDEEKLVSKVGLPYGIAFVLSSALEAIKNPPNLNARPASRPRPQPTPVAGLNKPQKQSDPANAKRLVFALEKLADDPVSKVEAMQKLGETAEALKAKFPHETAEFNQPKPVPAEENKLRGKRFLWSAKAKKPEKGKEENKLNKKPEKVDKTLRPQKKTQTEKVRAGSSAGDNLRKTSDSNEKIKVTVSEKDGKIKSSQSKELIEPPTSPRIKGIPKEPSKGAQDLSPVSPRGKKDKPPKTEKTAKDEKKDRTKSDKPKDKKKKPVPRDDTPWPPAGPQWLAPDPSWGTFGVQSADIPESLIEKLAKASGDAATREQNEQLAREAVAQLAQRQQAPQQQSNTDTESSTTGTKSEEQPRKQSIPISPRVTNPAPTPTPAPVTTPAVAVAPKSPRVVESSDSDDSSEENKPVVQVEQKKTQNSTLANLMKAQKERQEKLAQLNARTADASPTSKPEQTKPTEKTEKEQESKPEKTKSEKTTEKTEKMEVERTSNSKKKSKKPALKQSTSSSVLDSPPPPSDTPPAPPAFSFEKYVGKKVDKVMVTELNARNQQLYESGDITSEQRAKNKELIILSFTDGKPLAQLTGF